MSPPMPKLVDVVPQEISHGSMVQGMAYRVKYRKTDKDGKVVRVRTMIQQLGTHSKNRGGVYPAGVRCKSLVESVILDAGFVKEEMNHQIVTVEETPPEHVRSRGESYVSGAVYNRSKCATDELLITCFQVPFDDVTRLMLSHNHMMLVCRAFLTKALWKLPRDEAKNITFCDVEGYLSITAVAASENGKELQEVIDDGLDCEVLSYTMDVEEPGAASTISLALNKGHELALRTTEITAVAELRGEIIAQSRNTTTGTEVAFHSVLVKVRATLGVVADDPDLPEVFEFLITAGVGNNTYIDEFLEYARIFVDSKKRQLRFGAFGVVNKICKGAQWSKGAVLKRSYRKNPVHGWCPSPESKWKDWGEDILRLEDVLRFFHVECQPSFAKLKPQLRNTVMANVDIAAADAYYNARTVGKKKSIADVDAILLLAVTKYAEELSLAGEARQSTTSPWVKFIPSIAAKAAAVAAAPHLRVQTYNEATGAPQNSQVEFHVAHTVDVTHVVPWREWLKNNVGMGAMEADKAAAVAVLQALHSRYPVLDQNIEVMTRGKWMGTVAMQKQGGMKDCPIQKGDIILPPCVPRRSQVFEKSTHPSAVEVTVQVLRPTPGGDGDESKVERSSVLWIVPEFKIPVVNPAAAKSAVAEQWLWGEGAAETMHPFWAVRRMTKTQLAKEACETAKARPDALAIRFNCELRPLQISAVNVGVVNEVVSNMTRMFSVPFLVNTIELLPNEELIMEIADKVIATETKKRHWKDELKTATADALKSARKNDSSQKKS